MTVKKVCSNYNHSRTSISIKYCPQCGERFKSPDTTSCNEQKHRSRLKERDLFCCDCGKNLRQILGY